MLKTKYGVTVSSDVQLIDNVPIKTRSWNFPLVGGWVSTAIHRTEFWLWWQ